jgi:chromosome segregation ATPase
MKKKSTKTTKTTPEYDSQRETRVLLEDINKSVKTVAEQHDSIIKKLDEHDGQFKKIDQRFDIVEMAITENSRNIKALQTDVKGLKTDAEVLKTDVKALKEGQGRLEKGQEEIKQKLDTVTTDHERRLEKLETST